MGKLTTLFLWRMEQILDLYEQSYDPKRPLICVDEGPCQLIGDVLVPLPMKPGKPKREGYQYKRKGVCTIFIAFEPLTGWRFVQIRPQRTKVDYAHFMQAVADHFAQADLIQVVQDNLNTHNPGSFYQAFQPETAFGLAQRFEMFYTPNKASWLNMVEIELSILAKQCLDRRIGDMPWEGVNAIVKMARLICYLQDKLGAQLKARTHPYLPYSSIDIGTVEGGLKPNMVPEVCRIKIDRRLLPDESPATAEKEIRQVLEHFRTDYEEVDYEVHLFAQSWPAVNTDPESDLVKVMQRVITDQTGEDRPLVGYNQGSDSRYFATAGIPVVIFGPSDPAVGHAPNEHVTVDALLEATRIYALTAVRLLSANL